MVSIFHMLSRLLLLHLSHFTAYINYHKIRIYIIYIFIYIYYNIYIYVNAIRLLLL